MPPSPRPHKNDPTRKRLQQDPTPESTVQQVPAPGLKALKASFQSLLQRSEKALPPESAPETPKQEDGSDVLARLRNTPPTSGKGADEEEGDEEPQEDESEEESDPEGEELSEVDVAGDQGEDVGPAGDMAGVSPQGQSRRQPPPPPHHASSSPDGTLDLSTLPEDPRETQRSIERYLDKVKLLALAQAKRTLELLKAGDSKVADLVSVVKDLTELQMLLRWTKKLDKLAVKEKDLVPPGVKGFGQLRKLGVQTSALKRAAGAEGSTPDWVGEAPGEED